jgi:hypothetical protein
MLLLHMGTECHCSLSRQQMAQVLFFIVHLILCMFCVSERHSMINEMVDDCDTIATPELVEEFRQHT